MANNPTQLTILQDEIRRRYDTLSKRLKQVARYILDNSNSVAFDTVASIAQQADVPPFHVDSFCQRLRLQRL
ncbi:transcriptional regulator of the myo-inositol catabolic operon [Klebsiella pneumoniae]|nr:transcriptional regulator of the myo-inositol catabolic operon [Klebsiella pneumoniae]